MLAAKALGIRENLLWDSFQQGKKKKIHKSQIESGKMNSEWTIKRVWQTKFLKDEQKYAWENRMNQKDGKRTWNTSASQQSHQREIVSVSLSH